MRRSAEEIIKTYCAMSEASFLTLLSLLEPRHGYGIVQVLHDQSGGRVSLGASNVYTILYTMEQDGLIEVDGEIEGRKIYHITPLGREVLESETARITELARFANAVLSGGQLAE